MRETMLRRVRRWMVLPILLTVGAGWAQEPAPVIQSFTHDAGEGWLKAGSRLKVTLRGTEGAEAMYQVPGITEQRCMVELEPGQYVGVWTVPADKKLEVTGAALIGTLEKNGQRLMIQAAGNLRVDNQAPAWINLVPQPTAASGPRPTVSATWTDGAGSGVDPANVEMSVDMTTLGTTAGPAWSRATPERTENGITFQPSEDLALGEHLVGVQVTDRAGNVAIQRWNFNVASTRQFAITAFEHTATDPVSPGDVIRVRLEAPAAGTASYAIGNMEPRDLRQTQPGVYTGEYTVRKTDAFEDAVVTARYTSKNGQVFTVESNQKVNSKAAPTRQTLDKPIIDQPQNNQQVTSPLVVRGRAEPGSDVYVTIDYKARLLIFQSSARLGEYRVTTNEQGVWETQPIELDVLGADVTYTIQAAMVGADGTRSAAAQVQVQKQR